MSRSLNAKDLYKKKFKRFSFSGIWREIFGSPECNGFWLIYGSEKHGKTTLALMLANYLSEFEKTLYISAEEGLGETFISACQRVRISTDNKNLLFEEYLTLEELEEKIQKRRSADIIFLDNTTIYSDELKTEQLKKLLHKYQNKLFVFIAHEDRGEPYKITAKLVSKLAKAIIHVDGLQCIVSGRVPGGQLMIDDKKAILYHGETTEITEE